MRISGCTRRHITFRFQDSSVNRDRGPRIGQRLVSIRRIERDAEVFAQRPQPKVIGRWELRVLVKQPIRTLQRAKYPVGRGQEYPQAVEPFRKKRPVELTVVGCELSDAKCRQVAPQHLNRRVLPEESCKRPGRLLGGYG